MAGEGQKLATEWRPVPNWETFYEVSNHGQIRSVDRTVLSRDGRSQFRQGQVLAQTPQASGHLNVHLRRPGVSRSFRVHRLVALAFIDPNPAMGLEVCHGDGDPSNNHVENLRWDTRSSNHRDKARHGTGATWNSKKAACKRGHVLSASNTRLSRGRRICRTCAREWMQASRAA